MDLEKVIEETFQGAINTSSKDIEGKSARLLERHRQVEALDPGDATIAQRGFVSQRALLEMRLGGLGVDYGSADALYLSTGGGRWPRPPWVAAATTDALPGRRSRLLPQRKEASVQACRMRARQQHIH